MLFLYRRLSRMGLVGVVFWSALSGCSVPRGGDVHSIEPTKIPYELNATTTSQPNAFSPATVSGDGSGGTQDEPSVEPVSLFFIAGTQVVPITRMLLSPATAPQVFAALADGVPPGDEAAGLRSAVPQVSGVEVIVERGIARVELPAAFTSAIPGAEQRFAVAQIVLTLTRRAGIGQIVFTSGGRPQSVPRGRGDLTEPGGAVVCEDYATLLPAGFAC
jgi:hypothetical protein